MFPAVQGIYREPVHADPSERRQAQIRLLELAVLVVTGGYNDCVVVCRHAR